MHADRPLGDQRRHRGEPYTFDAVHSAHSTVEAAAGDTAAAETATDGGSNAGVVAPAGTKYTVNGHENWAMVGDEQPSILFDDVLSSYELDGGAESEVGQTMLEKAVIDNADALGLDNPNDRQYESKYFDLVDAETATSGSRLTGSSSSTGPTPTGSPMRRRAAMTSTCSTSPACTASTQPTARCRRW